MAEGRNEATVLLLSDDPETRREVTSLLREAGYRVVEATAEEAHTRAVEQQVDAIILDLSLSHTTLTVAQQLKDDPTTAAVPILHVRASEQEALLVAQGLEAGADMFLTKPVLPETLLCMVRALTRMGRAYREAERDRIRLAEVLRQMPSGVIVADAAGDLQLTNDRALEILCLPEIPRSEEARVEAIAATTDGVPAGLEGWPLRRALNTGERVTDEELEVACRGGGRVAVHVSAGPIRDREGKVVAGVLTLTDITHRKQAELALERQARLLDTLVENADVWLAYLDRDLRFVWVNSAYAAAEGVSRDEVVGRAFAEAFPASRDLQGWLERARDKGEPFRLHAFLRRPEHRPKRGWRNLDLSLLPVKDAAGGLQGIVLSAVDVTQQVQARQRIAADERARRELAKATNVEVNNRVRSNLAVVAGILQLQSVEEYDPRVAALLSDAATRLFAVSTVHEQLQVSPEGRIDLMAALARIVEVTRTAFTMRALKFTLDGEERVELPSRAVTSLAVVANELITNAARYCQPSDGDSCDIRVEVRAVPDAPQEKVRLSVWNSGNPLPEGFDPERAGGIGLRLVRMLAVDQYRGTLSLRPENGGTLAEVVVARDRLTR